MFPKIARARFLFACCLVGNALFSGVLRKLVSIRSEVQLFGLLLVVWRLSGQPQNVKYHSQVAHILAFCICIYPMQQ